MKGIILLVVAFLLWMIGGTVAVMAGDIYVSFVYPDGLTLGGYVWRTFVFSIPDFLLFGLTFMFYGACIVISPYRKTMGTILLLFGLYTLWTCYNGLANGQSAVIHGMNGILSVLFGLLGLLQKQDMKEVTPEQLAEPQQPGKTPEAQRQAFRNLQALLAEAQQKGKAGTPIR